MHAFISSILGRPYSGFSIPISNSFTASKYESPIARHPSNFTLRSQISYDLLQVSQPIQQQSLQFWMVWLGMVKDLSEEERWWV
jgi:hypothetical protein